LKILWSIWLVILFNIWLNPLEAILFTILESVYDFTDGLSNKSDENSFSFWNEFFIRLFLRFFIEDSLEHFFCKLCDKLLTWYYGVETFMNGVTMSLIRQLFFQFLCELFCHLIFRAFKCLIQFWKDPVDFWGYMVKFLCFSHHYFGHVLFSHSIVSDKFEYFSFLCLLLTVCFIILFNSNAHLHCLDTNHEFLSFRSNSFKMFLKIVFHPRKALSVSTFKTSWKSLNGLSESFHRSFFT